MNINYHKRKFAGVTNTPNGQVNGDTIFNYKQKDNLLTATYNGGRIEEGYILGRVHDDNSLDFVYHHIDDRGHLRSGHCISTPELLPDGRIRLYEKWEWTYGGEGTGESVVEEIK
ncbi:MAG: n-acetylglutamate synthase [Saprospiraceae bacterium]|uniref:N-acetylglutamate synthase n=1 Tax=Candidatus Opimibacter skivensis TaxID=2982028 RepID=A0A9D7SW83_9BACT|nr:n-acetylglutamate synthase [Candidatus Opimibacter skivensis]